MKTSESTANLVKALKVAQEQFPVIKKDLDGQIGNRKYKYADLSAVLAAVKPVLLSNGLVLQHGMEANGHTAVTCRISHISGEWQESSLNLPDNLTAQDLGSAITYERRYSTEAMLGISTEEDDDGKAASTPPAKKNYVLPVPGAGPYQPKATPPADPDAVPHEVTDGAGAPPEAVITDADTQIVTLEACTKERKDKKEQLNRGLKLIVDGGGSDWWQCYDKASMDLASSGKGKKFYARLEDKGGFKLCHELTQVGG